MISAHNKARAGAVFQLQVDGGFLLFHDLRLTFFHRLCAPDLFLRYVANTN